MGVRKIQITRKVEEIIKNYLFRGRYPTFQTITHQFGQWLREHTPGSPAFKPEKVFRKEKTSSEKYNRHVEAIHQDITDLYDATIQQSNRVMSDFHYVETEREKVLHELSRISKRIDELLLTSNEADFRHIDGHTISFENASSVNKEISTAFVNVKEQEVTLTENREQHNQVKIDYRKASFQTLQPSHKHSVLESLRYAFDDNINTAWWHVVKTKELGFQNEMKAELFILFDQEEEINSVSYTPHQGKPVRIQIEYTRDGTSFVPIHQKAKGDHATGISVWDFPKVKAKGIKFVFHKSDYDERSGGQYVYYFGAKNIQVFKKHYVSEGTLYTNPIYFQQPVQRLALWSKQETPYHTDLSYEVALYDPTKPKEEWVWYPISSYEESKPKYPKVITLSAKEERSIEAFHAEATRQVINGMQVFRLLQSNGSGLLSEEIVNSSTGETRETFHAIQNPKLFRGINQWKRERAYLPFRGDVPLNSHWNELFETRPEVIRTNYLPKGNELSLEREHGGFDDNFYRFSISVYSDESRSEPLSLSVISTLASGTRRRLGSYSVYVNQKRLSPVNDEVTLLFEKGWNEIQILYHWGNMRERKDLNREDLPLSTMIGKFNLFQEPLVRGDLEPMTYVDTHSLYHNVSPNNRNYFSIHERQVVLNYFPSNCLFQLIYEADPKEEQQGFVLRAELRRDPQTPHVTPKIHEIRLRAK